MTPEWLTAQLRDAGALDGAHSISGFRSEPIGEGAGMLGVIARLELEYAGEPGPIPSVVVKCATPTVANRAVAMTFHMYEREVRFFRELADRMRTGVPECYAAEIDVDTGDFVIVMDDLVGYRPGDQAAGCAVAECELCIDVMAALHSAWWEATDDPRLQWVPTVDGDLHRGGMVAAAEATWEPFLANFGHLVDPAIVAAGSRYLAGLPELHHRMGRGSQTLIHGDFRLDNILFGVEPGHHPIMLVDWQGIIVSKGVHDLAYLLSQNLATDLRRRARTGARRPLPRPARAARRQRLHGRGVLGGLLPGRAVAVRVRDHHRRRARPGQRAGHGVHERPRRAVLADDRRPRPARPAPDLSRTAP